MIKIESYAYKSQVTKYPRKQIIMTFTNTYWVNNLYI